MTQAAPLTFNVALALTAHHHAETFRQRHAQPAKAKQVYLNTLAVYAVKEYLECLEIEADLEASPSWDPLQQTLLDTAALQLPHRGLLECRPVLPEATHLEIPPEISKNSIGVVAVQLSDSLRSATLLGFVDHIPDHDVSLEALQSLEQLGPYLNNLSQVFSPSGIVISLQQWWDVTANSGLWKAVSDLTESFAPMSDYAFEFRRSANVSSQETAEIPLTSRVKRYCLGNSTQTLTFDVQLGIQAVSEQGVDIYVQVKAAAPQLNLPEDLHLSVLDDSGTEVMQAQSLGIEALQLMFSAELGEQFQLKFVWGSHHVTETFVI